MQIKCVLKKTYSSFRHKKHSCCLNLAIFDFRDLWHRWNSFINASSVFSCSLSSGASCPLPVLAHVLVPLLLPCSLRGALLCNARCIRCIFIPHYFTPHRALLETGDAAIWKKGLTLCCVTLWAVLSNFLSRHALINLSDAKRRNTLKIFIWENGCFCTGKCKWNMSHSSRARGKR